MNDVDRLRDMLRQLNELVGSSTMGSVKAPQAGRVGCTIKFLPERLLVKAAEVARKVNPRNAPVIGPVAVPTLQRSPGSPDKLAALRTSPAALTKLHIAVITSKYWGSATRELTVSFMEPTPNDVRARIVAHLNAWSTYAGISFVETQGVGDVRISLGPGGYYSYLGTDIKLIPTGQQTMNLEGFTMNTPESEYARVVRHEAGHTLGFPHEHMRKELVARIDPAKAYTYFFATQGWDPATVDQQVLTPLDDATIYGTPPDETSLMCYQLPGTITVDGQPITGGIDINTWDAAFAAAIYPKLFFQPPQQVPAKPAASMEYAKDWGPSQDPAITL
jgi:hypothetical protein